MEVCYTRIIETADAVNHQRALITIANLQEKASMTDAKYTTTALIPFIDDTI